MSDTPVTYAAPLQARHWIAGRWVDDAESGDSPVHNPSTGEVIARTPHAGARLVDEAVRTAHAALPAWAETPPIERARLLFRYAMLLEQDFEELARGLTCEHGKTLGEARGDVRRGIEVVEYACGAPELLKGESLGNVARGVDCHTLRQPLGVCVGITPYNFPAMVPLWMLPMALACGNTFILKPSEKVPLTAVRLFERLLAAGLPAGVAQLVHGAQTCVDALLTHPLVRAVSFVGSTPVARHVAQTATAHGKRVQAAGGAKNFVFVLPDADGERAVQGLIDGAFGCAGQRCMAASTAVLVGDGPREEVLPLLAERSRALRIGRTDQPAPGPFRGGARDPIAPRDANAGPEVQLGPVISAPHRTRVTSLIESGLHEGASLLVDGRQARVPTAPGGFYLGPCILDGVHEHMGVAREEIFGPVLGVMHCRDLDEALALAARTPFGNGACLFTRSGRHARAFAHAVKAGMIGINVGVPAPLAYFPFSGWDDSFYGDLHMQGHEGVAFYTRQKVVTSRWPDDAADVWQRQ